MDEPVVRLEPLKASHAVALFDVLAEPSLYEYLDEEPPPSVAWLAERFAALQRGAPAELPSEHRVEYVQAEIDPANQRSIRLVESLGFVADGTIGTDRRFVRRLHR